MAIAEGETLEEKPDDPVSTTRYVECKITHRVFLVNAWQKHSSTCAWVVDWTNIYRPLYPCRYVRKMRVYATVVEGYRRQPLHTLLSKKRTDKYSSSFFADYTNVCFGFTLYDKNNIKMPTENKCTTNIIIFMLLNVKEKINFAK